MIICVRCNVMSEMNAGLPFCNNNEEGRDGRWRRSEKGGSSKEGSRARTAWGPGRWRFILYVCKTQRHRHRHTHTHTNLMVLFSDILIHFTWRSICIVVTIVADICITFILIYRAFILNSLHHASYQSILNIWQLHIAKKKLDKFSLIVYTLVLWDSSSESLVILLECISSPVCLCYYFPYGVLLCIQSWGYCV